MKILSKKKIIRNVGNIIGIVLSILGLYFAFNDFNLIQFISLIRNTNILYIFSASILLVFSVWIRAIRWNLLLINEKYVKYKTLYEIEMIGYFANNVLPFRIGEVYRSIILSRIINIPKTTIFGTIVIERILDLFSLVIISLFLFVYPVDDIIKKYIYHTLMIIGIIGFFLIIIKYIFNKKIKIKFINNFIKGLLSIRKEYINKLSLLSIILWLMYWVNTHLIQASLGLNMGILDTLLILIISSLSLAIPSAPGMIGTFHLAVNYTMKNLLGYPSDISNTYTIILHAYGFITLTAIGAMYFIKRNYKRKNI